LSPGIELTAYRLVQECLTNAMRHASGTPARVALEYGRASLTLRVVNSGGPAPTPALTGGHGLLGMRERVELYGGTLDYGPGSSGWEVLGTLPYDEMLGSPPTDIRPRPASAMGE
jgi:signal transduction histidine kinase